MPRLITDIKFDRAERLIESHRQFDEKLAEEKERELSAQQNLIKDYLHKKLCTSYSSWIEPPQSPRFENDKTESFSCAQDPTARSDWNSPFSQEIRSSQRPRSASSFSLRPVISPSKLMPSSNTLESLDLPMSPSQPHTVSVAVKKVSTISAMNQSHVSRARSPSPSLATSKSFRSQDESSVPSTTQNFALLPELDRVLPSHATRAVQASTQKDFCHRLATGF